jgi:hypothetical protein
MCRKFIAQHKAMAEKKKNKSKNKWTSILDS